MSQAFVDLAPLVPAGTRTVIVHGVAASTRQRLASLLPEASIRDLADLAGTSGPAGADPAVGGDPAVGVDSVIGSDPAIGGDLVVGGDPAVGADLVVGGDPRDGGDPAVGADLAVMEVASHVGQARIAAEILELAGHLRDGAVLLLVTARRLGSARQLTTLEDMFGTAEVVQRSGSAVVLRAVRGPEVRATADATAAAPTIETVLLGRDLRFTTGAGLFAKSRIDDGTRLLIEALPSDHQWRDVLDLGCGYGPIGIAVASRWPQVRVTMTDIDPLAVGAARANAGLNGVDGRCEACVSDGISALADRRFDAVLSHLPTHVPKATLRRLIDESANVLRPGGESIVVTASAVDLRDRIASAFGTVEVLAESRAGTTPPYRVVRAAQPDGV